MISSRMATFCSMYWSFALRIHAPSFGMVSSYPIGICFEKMFINYLWVVSLGHGEGEDVVGTSSLTGAFPFFLLLSSPISIRHLQFPGEIVVMPMILQAHLEACIFQSYFGCILLWKIPHLGPKHLFIVFPKLNIAIMLDQTLAK
eukprot:Gb_11439 [translate_table: standard]